MIPAQDMIRMAQFDIVLTKKLTKGISTIFKVNFYLN